MPQRSLFAMFLALVAGCVQDSPVGDKKKDESRVIPQDKRDERRVVPQGKTTRNDAELIVRAVVAERLKVKSQSLDMNKPIADELDVVQVVMTLEERFMFDIPDLIIEKHGKAKLGEPACKLSASQLVVIVEESRVLAEKKR